MHKVSAWQLGEHEQRNDDQRVYNVRCREAQLDGGRRRNEPLGVRAV
jgi:hypothetical protein